MDIQKIKSQDWVLLVAVVLLVVAFTNFMFVLKDVSDYSKWTGYATDTGKANLTVSSEANIIFFVNNTDWGAGGVNGSIETYADLFTNGTVSAAGSWSVNNQPLVLENVGNSNVYVDLKANNTAQQFINGTNPEYEIEVSDNESTSCSGGVGNFSAYQTIGPVYNRTCDNFGYSDDSDSLNVDIHVRVPQDSPTGTKASIITASAEVV